MGLRALKFMLTYALRFALILLAGCGPIRFNRLRDRGGETSPGHRSNLHQRRRAATQLRSATGGDVYAD